MKKRIFFLAAVWLLAVSVTTACGGAANTRQEVRTHSKDGLLGITEVNPNMPLSKTYRTYSDDVRVMEAAIKERFPMVTNTTITLNGPVAMYCSMCLPEQARKKLPGSSTRRRLFWPLPLRDTI